MRINAHIGLRLTFHFSKGWAVHSGLGPRCFPKWTCLSILRLLSEGGKQMDWCVCKDVEIVVGCRGEERLEHGAESIDLLVSVHSYFHLW